MRSDLTYKTIFGNRFMVEELMRWLVADLHGAGELVDALDFSGMVRVQEQSVTTGAGGQHGYANDIVWQVPLRERPEGDVGEGWRSLVVMLEFQSAVDRGGAGHRPGDAGDATGARRCGVGRDVPGSAAVCGGRLRVA